MGITKVGRVMVTVSDQDKAIDFYCGTLGFEKTADVPFGNGDRWIEVTARSGGAAIALITPGEQNKPGVMTNVGLETDDIDKTHADLKAKGVDVDDEVSRFGDPVPPMFWFRDQDGNTLLAV
jgi:catechol 2,3-dioxygenase-like lactoylglutathione lyase family enzyme